MNKLSKQKQKRKKKGKTIMAEAIKSALRDAGYRAKEFPSDINPDGKTVVAQKSGRTFIIEVSPDESFEECILRNLENTTSKMQRSFLHFILGY